MGDPATHEIQLNGKTREISNGCTLADLLAELNLDARWIVAELNGEALSRESYASACLAHGDQLELVSPVAGG